MKLIILICLIIIRLRDAYIHTLPLERTSLRICNSIFIRNNGNILKMLPPSTAKSLKNNEPIQATTSANLETESKNMKPSYIALFVILLIFSSNQWSRQALFYLCDFSNAADSFKHINAALSFDKEMYATLASLGFTVVFAIASLFAGGIVDKTNRKQVLILACTIWSLATSAQSVSSDFSQLIPLRIIVGLSQAFFNPAAYTLISDIFPSQLVGRMNGILSGGVYIGGGLASLSILLDNQVGWRSTLNFIGFIGIIIAILGGIFIFDPREQSKTLTETIQSSSTNNTMINIDELKLSFNNWLEKLKEILTNDESALILLATALRFCAGFSIGIWKAPYVFAKFPSEIAEFAGTNAAIVSIGGLLSSILGGYISDNISKGSPTISNTSVSDMKNDNTSLSSSGWFQIPRARIWVAAIGSLLAAPTWIGFIQATTPYEATAWLLAEYLVAECWIGPTLAALFESVGKEKRGSAQGVFSLLTALGNFAPILVGYLSNQLSTAGTSDGLGQSLLYVVSSAYMISGLLFGAAAMKRDKIIEDTYIKAS